MKLFCKSNINQLKAYSVINFTRVCFSINIDLSTCKFLHFIADIIEYPIITNFQTIQYMIHEISCICYVLEHGWMYVSVCINIYYIHENSCRPQMSSFVIM